MQGIHRQIHTSPFFYKTSRVPTSLGFPARCQLLSHIIRQIDLIGGCYTNPGRKWHCRNNNLIIRSMGKFNGIITIYCILLIACTSVRWVLISVSNSQNEFLASLISDLSLLKLATLKLHKLIPKCHFGRRRTLIHPNVVEGHSKFKHPHGFIY